MKEKKLKKHFIFIGLSAILFAGFVIAINVLADSASTSVTVGNATPSVSGITFNNESAMTLTENTTTRFWATSTVSDANGCNSIYAVTADFYRSGVGNTNCNEAGEAINNYCYPRVNCSVVTYAGANTCDGGTDTSVQYECYADLQFYAHPTDGSSPWSAQNWVANFEAGDGLATTTDNASSGTELNTGYYLDVDSSVDFGTLSANTDTGATNSTTMVTNTGNADMDPQISSASASGMCSDYPTCAGDVIPPGQQEYSNTSFTYGVGTDLTSTPTSLDLALPIPASTTTPVTANVYWGIGILAGQASGDYTGSNTLTAVTGI